MCVCPLLAAFDVVVTPQPTQETVSSFFTHGQTRGRRAGIRRVCGSHSCLKKSVCNSADLNILLDRSQTNITLGTVVDVDNFTLCKLLLKVIVHHWLRITIEHIGDGSH